MIFLALSILLFELFYSVGLGLYVFFPKARKSYKEILIDHRKVALHLKVVDQYGEPASNYQIKICYEYSPWYHRFLYLHSLYKTKDYVLMTDKKGEIKFTPFFFRKAYSMRFEEIDQTKYVFRKSKYLKFRNQEISSIGGATLSWIDPEGKGQHIELRVLRHGPAANLKVYKPKMKRGKDGKIESIEAKDENVFTLDIENNEIKEGEGEGDILITAKNMNKVIKSYREHFIEIDWAKRKEYEKSLNNWSIEDFEKERVWEVEVIGRNGWQIQPADAEVITYAPEEGYKKALTYKIFYTIGIESFEEKFKGVGWQKVTDEGIEVPNEENKEEAKYKVIGGFSPRCFYLRNGNKYGIMEINLGWNNWEGKIIVSAEGLFNWESNNLWSGEAISRRSVDLFIKDLTWGKQ